MYRYFVVPALYFELFSLLLFIGENVTAVSILVCSHFQRLFSVVCLAVRVPGVI